MGYSDCFDTIGMDLDMIEYHKTQYETGDYVQINIHPYCVCKIVKANNVETHRYPYDVQPVTRKGVLFNIGHEEISYGVSEEDAFLIILGEK